MQAIIAMITIGVALGAHAYIMSRGEEAEEEE